MFHDSYSILVAVHAFAGGVGLLFMLLPLVGRKGTALHKRTGWVFAVAMAVAAGTGLVISATFLLDVGLVKPLPADPAKREAMLATYRMYGWFFLLLSTLLSGSVAGGFLASRGRRDGRIRALEIHFSRVFGWTLVLLGGATFVAGLNAGAVLLIGFGFLGVIGGVGELRAAAGGLTKAGGWKLRHAEAMLGAATAGTTAFTVQIVGRAVGDSPIGLLAWFVPVALGTGATVWWSRRLRRTGSAAPACRALSAARRPGGSAGD